MDGILKPNQQADFLKRGYSRRDLGRIAALLTAGASMPFYGEPALAQRGGRGAPSGAVMIDSNENPMGPCAEAADAIHAMVAKGGRYLTSENSKMAAALAEQEGLDTSCVQPFAGSSDALHRTVMAFCSPGRPYIFADPSYEAGGRAAQFIGAQSIGVPLAPGSFAHDVKKMAAAHATPGVIYVCNPNNPTGTVTPKEDIEWLVNNKPSGAIVLLDEAYTHFSEHAVKASYLVAAGKDLIILRTFSKIYGMAGLRAGAALARPDLLRRLSGYTSVNFLPITAMAGATASLQSKTVLAERRKIYDNLRAETFDFLKKQNIEYIPSEANHFMMNVKRPGQSFSQAMAREGVIIGRVWPVWPTWVRVTIGTAEDMAKFRDACLKCYAA